MSRKPPTPLPFFRVVVVSVGMFCNSFIATVLLPFLTFMVSDFQIADRPEDIGRYSGYLVSSFMVGQLLSSYLWGLASDCYGRKFIIVFGLFSTGVSFLMFGFSTSYSMAITLRFISGILNGVIGVTKTYLSELTDESNQAQGFAILGVNRAVGMIIGPMVGGFLCMPADKYPWLFPKGSLFDIYPYALPCIVGFMVAMFGAVSGWIVLEETRTSSSSSQSCESMRVHEISNSSSSSSNEQTPLLGSRQEPCTVPSCASAGELPAAKPRPSLLQTLSDKQVALPLLLFMLVSATYIQFDELFALWSRLPIDEGGLNFTSTEQGIAFTIAGICLLVYQLFCFAPIERALGCLGAFRVGLLISIPSFFLLPMAAFVRLEDDSDAPDGMDGIDQDGTPVHAKRFQLFMWACVGLAQLLRTVGGLQAFTSTFIMISNSVLSNSRGSLNGIGQTLGALGRTIGPICCGTLFSWSLQNNLGPPLDYHFTFIVLAVLVLATWCISLLVDDSINSRKSETDDFCDSSLGVSQPTHQDATENCPHDSRLSTVIVGSQQDVQDVQDEGFSEWEDEEAQQPRKPAQH
ncbi:major facilitator superfamily domain-containing protein [Entophlyctis helioformis]|nr:major facilitator superfamily domain-containing protein [Entophlyctis helioformis]